MNYFYTYAFRHYWTTGRCMLFLNRPAGGDMNEFFRSSYSRSFYKQLKYSIFFLT